MTLTVGMAVTVAPKEGYPLRFTPYQATVTSLNASGQLVGIVDDRCTYTVEQYTRERLPRARCGRGCRHRLHIGAMYVTPRDEAEV